MNEYYRVKQIGDGRYRIYEPLGVYMDLFEGSEHALLWDTGFGLSDLHTVVKKITEKPLYVVNSHGHVDHACGNSQFTEDIYIHPADIPLCIDTHGVYRKKITLNDAKNAVDFLTGQPVGIITDQFDEDEYLNRGTGNLKEVREGHVFDLGGMHLRVVELPGHTSGSIGLLYEEEKILYAGDAINGSLWLFLKESCPLSVYRKTLKKAWELDFDTMIISHWPDPLKKEVLLDYMDTAENIRYEEGLPFSASLVPEANARTILRKGYTMADQGKEGFASIVISEDKIDC